MFTEHIDQLRREAITAYPSEAVWIIYADGECRQYANVASDPATQFRIDKRTLARAMARGIAVIVHSHPDGPDCPSEADMRGQRDTAVPWGIVSTNGEDASPPFYWGAGVPVADLEQRPFRHGVTDCYSLIRDWYAAELDVELPEFPRDWEWWRHGGDLYRLGLESAGFVPVDRAEAQRGDMFFCQIHSAVPNHAGVYLGDGLAMHHLTASKPFDPTRRPKVEPIHRWLPFVVAFYRHASQME